MQAERDPGAQRTWGGPCLQLGTGGGNANGGPWALRLLTPSRGPRGMSRSLGPRPEPLEGAAPGRSRGPPSLRGPGFQEHPARAPPRRKCSLLLFGRPVGRPAGSGRGPRAGREPTKYPERWAGAGSTAGLTCWDPNLAQVSGGLWDWRQPAPSAAGLRGAAVETPGRGRWQGDAHSWSRAAARRPTAGGQWVLAEGPGARRPGRWALCGQQGSRPGWGPTLPGGSAGRLARPRWCRGSAAKRRLCPALCAPLLEQGSRGGGRCLFKVTACSGTTWGGQLGTGHLTDSSVTSGSPLVCGTRSA